MFKEPQLARSLMQTQFGTEPTLTVVQTSSPKTPCLAQIVNWLKWGPKQFSWWVQGVCELPAETFTTPNALSSYLLYLSFKNFTCCCWIIGYWSPTVLRTNATTSCFLPHLCLALPLSRCGDLGKGTSAYNQTLFPLPTTLFQTGPLGS